LKDSQTAPGPNDDAALVRALPWQWASTGLNTVFGTLVLGSSVFLLFLSELGLPKAQIGIVLSVFPFCGLLALWFAPLARRMGRTRVFLVCFGARKVAIAGLLLLPLIVSRRGAGAGLALVLLALGWWLYGRVKPDGAHTTRTVLRRALSRLTGGRRR
jgi:hypothetical protein